jgi:predicted component of type VI protein secretion system
MQVVLVMFRPDGERRSFSITRDMTIIGRREDSDLRIPLGDVSRKHCRLIKDGDALRVEDLGSSNGTYCNGTRITQCDLTPGDTLQVGPVVFVTQIDGTPADEDLSPIVATAPAEEGASAEAGAEAAEGVVDLEAADEEGGAEFDPMEALTGDDEEGSGFDFVLEDELPAETPETAAEDIVDLEESEQEHDQKA